MNTIPRFFSAANIICGAIIFTIYLLTLAPTVQGFDSAELTVGAYSLGFVHAPGYPLYMLFGHIFSRLPLGDVGKQLNLMSAIFATASVLILLKLQSLDVDVAYALPAVCMFATAPVFWSQAIRAEVYTLHTLIVVCVLYIWRQAHVLNRPLYLTLCFAILGLGMGNHPTTSLLWGALVGCLIWESPKFRYFGALGTMVGLAIIPLVYSYFPLRGLVNPPIDYVHTYFNVDLSMPSGIWWMLSAKMFHHAFHLDKDPTKLIHEVLRFASLVWDSFLGVGAVLGAWGLFALRTKEVLWNRLLLVYFAINIICFVCYHVIDKEVMFIPVLLVWSVWMSYGVKELEHLVSLQMSKRQDKIIKKIIIGAMLVIVAFGVKFNWQVVSLNDNKKVYEFASQILEDAEPYSLIVNHWVTASVIDYLQLVEGRRPDVESFNIDFYNLALLERYGSIENELAKTEWYEWLKRRLSERPICFIEPLPVVPENYRWIRQGVCWKLTHEP